MLRWFVTRRGEVPIVPTRSTAVLYQAWGTPGDERTLGAGAARAAAARLGARAAAYDADRQFPVETSPTCARPGCSGCSCRTALGGLGAELRRLRAVAYELARGNGATALVFNMHASVTGALAGIPDELAALARVPEAFFAARDRILRAAADGAFYAVAMSERGVGSRLSQLTTAYEPVDGGFHIKGAKSFVSGCRARRRLPGRRPVGGRRRRWCPSSWCRPAPTG